MSTDIDVLVERGEGTTLEFEVISPGTLPKGMAVADLGRKAVRRNPLVADLLHRIDFIEKAGTGIRRIRDGAKAVDCPEPVFEADNFVTVTFRPNPEVRQAAGGELPPTPQTTGEATGEVPGKLPGKSPGKSPGKYTHNCLFLRLFSEQ